MAKITYYVDIPNPHDPKGAWACMGSFETHEDAARYAQETFGADAKGRIHLISKVKEDDHEE